MESLFVNHPDITTKGAAWMEQNASNYLNDVYPPKLRLCKLFAGNAAICDEFRILGDCNAFRVCLPEGVFGEDYVLNFRAYKTFYVDGTERVYDTVGFNTYWGLESTSIAYPVESSATMNVIYFTQDNIPNASVVYDPNN
jgi:hypothetical protein